MFDYVELRYQGFLVLPPSYHISGGKYEFRFVEIPSCPPITVSIDGINNLINHFCAEINLFAFDTQDGRSFSLYNIVQEKCIEGSNYSYEGFRDLFQDNLILLQSCHSKEAALALGFLLFENHLYEDARSAFEKAHSFYSHYNLAVLISQGILRGSEEDFYNHLNIVKYYERINESRIWPDDSAMSSWQIETDYQKYGKLH